MTEDRYIELEIPTELREDGAPEVKYFIYLRVSTDKQATERQQDGLNAFLKTMPRNWSHAGTYEDHSSGKNFSRPQYKLMLNMLKKREAKVVVVWDMSRFARSQPDFHTQQVAMKNMGAHLYLVKEHLVITPEDNAFQNLIANLLTAVHQFSREAIVEATIEGMAAKKAANPFVVYGQAPKIRGRQWKTLVHMYYAKKEREHGKVNETSYAFTLADIARHFNITKPAVSDLIGKHVELGSLTLRQPAMKRMVGGKVVTVLDIPKARQQKGRKYNVETLLHAQYWPKEIRAKVSKKYGGNYEKNKSKDAFKYGKKLYRAWLKRAAKAASSNAEVIEIATAEADGQIKDKAEFVAALEDALDRGY